MTTRWKWLALFVIFLLAVPAQAKVIRGSVTDAATGEPLPVATVRVLGTYHGAISNAEGGYEVELYAFPAVVEVRYIGYRSQRIEIAEDAPDVHNFALELVPLEMEEIVVTAADGPGIMRKVIAQKQTWWDALETFRVSAYSRFVFRRSSEIVAITESLSEGFWDHRKGWREVVIDKRVTENLDFEFGEFVLPAAQGVNLYEDETELGGHHLVGVTHPDALDHYDFVLAGRRKMDDRIIYDIDVRPKHRLETAFEGRVAVLDSAYALVEVELTPNQAFLFPPPIRGWTSTMRQQFSNFGGDFYLPVGWQSEDEIGIGIIGLQFPTIEVQRISRLTGYEVNVALPDSLYEQRREVVVDSARVERDSLLARTALAVPLDEIEQEAYARIDSAMTLYEAYKPKGFLARFIEDDEKNGEKERTEKPKKKGRFKWRSAGWFNRVDGVHLEQKIAVGSSQTRVAFGGGGGYNFGLKKWAFEGKATLRWGASKRGWVSLAGFLGTQTRYRSRLYGRMQTGLQQILGFEDYFDYFWREGMSGSAGYRFGNPHKATVQLSGGINVARHESVNKTTDWHLIGDRDAQRPNPSVDPGNLRSAFFRASFKGESAGPSLLFGRREVALEVEHSRPGFGSDFAFTQFRLRLDWRVETLFKRRLLPNVLDVRVVGSAFTGTLPRQRFEILDTWLLGGISTFGGFRTRVDRPYEGERVLGVFWEHHFRTVPFELLGWRWAAERNIGLTIHGGHGRTWFGDRTLAGLDYEPQYLDGFHHELGASINGLFYLFRMDFTVRLDAPGVYVGAGLARF